MRPLRSPLLKTIALAGALSSGTWGHPAWANDFPTLERVQYVSACMRKHPGPEFEMVAKCSCMLDHLASTVSYEEFVALKTATDAVSIGGERGGSLRENPDIKAWVARLKVLEANARKACFVREL
ncbi:MAG: hypothetical protein C4K60_14580 [Ideonella sp. MAG2]|nr:MAG: hypothetical protein C4K60_14580 [Ideonella sp. MAG2]